MVKREVKIALTVLTAIVILVWGIHFLSNTSIFDKDSQFVSVYTRIDGLKVSSSVSYRGYKVGQVNKVEFIGENFDKVAVSFNVKGDLLLPSNTVAKIASADIMGTKEIQLIPGDAYFYAESGDTLISDQEESILMQLNEHIAPIKHRAVELMSSLDSVLVIMQGILDGEEDANLKTSLARINRTISNLESVTGTLDDVLTESAPRINNIVLNLDSVTTLFADNKDNIGRGIENIVDMTDSLTRLNVINRINSLLLTMDSVAIKINSGEGTLGQLVNNDDFYFNLNTIFAGFQNNPKRYINVSVFGGNSDKERVLYGVAVKESSTPLMLADPLYAQFPDLKEIHKNSTFYYVTNYDKKLNQAEKALERVQMEYPDAFIVKF